MTPLMEIVDSKKIIEHEQPKFNSAISISNLDFSYPKRGKLLSIRQLDVASGKIVSILGPSGCGKTTLLLLIAGLIKANSGQISVFGTTPADYRHTGNMAVVFQNPALLPWRTVIMNLRLPFDLQGVAVDKEKLINVLNLVGLNGSEDVFVDQLSAGMQSRVSLARAIVTKPSLLLMDEPFGNLDEFNRVRLNLKLAEIQKELGMTVLLITHNINDAILISDRILVMKSFSGENRPTEIQEDISITFPNRTIESSSSSEYSNLYQSIVKHFQQEIK